MNEAGPRNSLESRVRILEVSQAVFETSMKGLREDFAENRQRLDGLRRATWTAAITFLTLAISVAALVVGLLHG